MKKRITYSIILSLLFFFSCVEELDIVTTVEAGYKDDLVVEATITDEMKNQVILLSRAYRLEETGPLPESNAQISVLDNNGNTYGFQETEAGKYESVIQFAALSGVEYQLNLVTNNGRIYNSSIEGFKDKSQIEELFVERDFNENEEEGVSIYINSSDPVDEEKYYRYTYEETYKVIAPSYVPDDLTYTYIVEILPDGTPISIVTYHIGPKEEEQRTCFNTVNSNTIIIRDTAEFVDDADTDRFRVRFLGRDNYIISHRYSINVKQYTQSIEAYNYYRVLKSLSGSESLLSETQPGYINSNVVSSIDENELVIGYFEVSSVDTKRVYFNYADLFPGELLPPWLNDCDIFAPSDGYTGVPPDGPVIDALKQGHKYFKDNLDPVLLSPFVLEGAYDLVYSNCGDCRVLGNNYPPDFWEE